MLGWQDGPLSLKDGWERPHFQIYIVQNMHFLSQDLEFEDNVGNVENVARQKACWAVFLLFVDIYIYSSQHRVRNEKHLRI